MSELIDKPVASEAPAYDLTSPSAQVAGESERFSRFPLSAWIALVGLVALIALGGYAMYGRFFAGTTVASGRELVDIVGRRGMPNWGQPRVRPDGVHERGEDRYQVKAGDALLDVTKRGERWNFRYSYDRADLATPEQQAAMTARFRLSSDAAFAKALNVSAEQVEKLKQVPARVGMAVGEADEQRLRDLFDAYLRAAPPRAKEAEALVSALRDVGASSLDATRAAIAERAKQVQAILTPEQIARFRTSR